MHEYADQQDGALRGNTAFGKSMLAPDCASVPQAIAMAAPAARAASLPPPVQMKSPTHDRPWFEQTGQQSAMACQRAD
jgi:hypothetical protein